MSNHHDRISLRKHQDKFLDLHREIRKQREVIDQSFNIIHNYRAVFEYLLAADWFLLHIEEVNKMALNMPTIEGEYNRYNLPKED